MRSALSRSLRRLVPISVLLIGLAAWLAFQHRPKTHVHVYDQPTPAVLKSVRFLDNTRGWIAGRKGIFYTGSAGQDWQKYAVALATAAPRGPRLVDEVGVIVWTDDRQVMIRGEGGFLTFHAISEVWEGLTVEGRFLHMGFANRRDGWAVGHTTVYRTSDGGRTWVSVEERPTRKVLLALFAASAQEVWLGGDQGVLVHTTDGGLTWKEQELDTDKGDISSIRFISPEIGWLCGIRNFIFHTEDSGLHWSRQKSPVEAGFTDLSFTDQSEGWLVGDQGVVLHTCDGGHRWQDLNMRETKEVLVSVQGLPGGQAWVVGEEGIVLHITDHGGHWRVVKLE